MIDTLSYQSSNKMSRSQAGPARLATPQFGFIDSSRIILKKKTVQDHISESRDKSSKKDDILTAKASAKNIAIVDVEQQDPTGQDDIPKTNLLERVRAKVKAFSMFKAQQPADLNTNTVVNSGSGAPSDFSVPVFREKTEKRSKLLCPRRSRIPGDVLG